MRQIKFALAFAACLSPLAAFGQSAPANLPAQSVYGRMGIPGDTGPGQAIPFSVLGAQLLGGAQSANTVYAGPSSGASASPAFRALVGADLPVPGASSLGGVKSLTCATSNWFSTLSTAGVFGCSQPNFTDLVGSIAGAQIPTGTITSAMILDGTIVNADISASAAIVLSKLAAQNNNTIVGNKSGSSAAPAALTGDQVGAILCVPNRQYLTTGTNATYTTPTCNSALPTRIEFEMAGGGGGGAGSGTTPGAATSGGNTCWNTSGTACTTPLFSANGGSPGQAANGVNGAGGTTTSCDLGLNGGAGSGAANSTTGTGGGGGQSYFGGGAPTNSSNGAATAGTAGAANTGGGASGASASGTAGAGGGAGAGGYCRKIITSPAASYVYTIGASGAGGTLGTSGAAGGNGGTGLISATAYWQ